jgi:hypothetical protein
VLEIDHVVPLCGGGSDDPINLVTSCWECNRGKGGAPLDQVVTGEDPHDRAVLLLERERQLREYNEVLRTVRQRAERERDELAECWCLTGRGVLSQRDRVYLLSELERTPAEVVARAIRIALSWGVDEMRYVAGILKNWREDGRI